MSSSLTYPGVYVEEIPSQVHTMTGVSTSVTAFIGRALKGVLNQPITINSFSDYQRNYGGLWSGNYLGYAVRDFFLNGGNQAIIVRVDKGSTAAEVELSIIDANDSDPKLKLQAINEGSWGNKIQVVIDHNVSSTVAQSYGLATTDLFNLTVIDTSTGTSEQYYNLTVKDSPNRIDRSLANQSNLVVVNGSLSSRIPDKTPIPTTSSTSATNTDTSKDSKTSTDTVLPTMLSGGGDGSALDMNSFISDQAGKTGLYALDNVNIFNLLCIPGYNVTGDVDKDVLQAAASYCESRDAFFIVDAPSTWTNKINAKNGIASLGITSKNAAVYFPRIQQIDPLTNHMGTFLACGMVAGTIARIDGARGIWKAPAGLEANLQSLTQLQVNLTDAENGELNPLGINCLRTLPAAGTVIWGARTLQGNDTLTSEWKYIPVRRLSLYIKQSILQGTQWVVFEPNTESLWAQIRLNIGSFMQRLFRQGAFQGNTQQSAYFVKCDNETTTQDDIDRGVVNILIGFAPVKPAEFVVIKIQQVAGQN